MKVKICGMRDPQNILEIAQLKPDFMGFIFYPPSPRFLSTAEGFPHESLEDICTTGVFVNENITTIEEAVHMFRLKAVQLHGNETVAMCKSVQQLGVKVLKAVPVSTTDDFEQLERFSGSVDYCVLDTKTSQHGGSGTKFNWELLHYYNAEIPFLLGGGIDEEDAEQLLRINHPMMAGVDINSRFELSPGVKDTAKVKRFLKAII